MIGNDRNWFSPSIMWDPGFELRLSSLAAAPAEPFHLSHMGIKTTLYYYYYYYSYFILLIFIYFEAGSLCVDRFSLNF